MEIIYAFITLAILAVTGLAGLGVWWYREVMLTQQAMEDEVSRVALYLGVDLDDE